MDKIKIVCLGGSLDKASSTLALLNYSEKLFRTLGAEVIVIDIKKLALPLFSFERMKKGPGSKFAKILKTIHSADGYLFASPEYHGTVSAAFKNAIDHLEHLSKFDPPYLSYKPVGCIAVGGAENAGHTTLSTMISIVNNLRGITASNSMAIGSGNRIFTPARKLRDPNVKRRLERLVEEVYMLALKLKH
jgi:FMN reductase